MTNNKVPFLNYADGILIVDNKGTITYSVRFNPRFDKDKDGIDFSNVLGKNFLDIYTSVDEEESTIYECLKTGKAVYRESQLVVDFNNDPIKIDNLTIPIRNAGKILGAIEISKDVTKIQDISVPDSDSEKMGFYNKNNGKKTAEYTFDDILTKDPIMLDIIEKAKKMAKSNSPILVYGETGTGKELFVQAIHNESNRAHNPFVAQNFASIPDNLFESILFGSTKGAFTGSIDRKGLFESADGGTLFLDELNSMPLHLQSKLLRVLQDGNIKRVGSSEERHVNVRLITAMNVEPSSLVEKGILRSDLFYRINVNSIEIPPLRKRKGDIRLLTNYYIYRYNSMFGINVKGLSPHVHNLFMSYSWPGNVRELQHVIESAMNIITEGYIELKHLPIYLNSIDDIPEAETNLHPAKNYFNVTYNNTDSLAEIMNDIEKEIIQRKYNECDGNVSQTAKILGIPRQTLQYKLNKFNIK